jgi:hypothetical protein
MAEDVILYWLAPSPCISDFNLVFNVKEAFQDSPACIKTRLCQTLQVLSQQNGYGLHNQGSIPGKDSTLLFTATSRHYQSHIR